MPIEAVAEYVVSEQENEANDVRSYVEWQSKKTKEKVTHLEKVASESLYGNQMNAWSVHTNKSKWWVITRPMMNLYSQKLFPSLDYTISFHVGLMTRVEQSNLTREQEAAHGSIEAIQNNIAQLHGSLFNAKSVHDFQSVGMKCRECLLIVSKHFSDQRMVPPGEEAPQAGNFVLWAELIAQTFAPGSSNERVRGYLKDISKATWQMVNWLTHSHNANRADAGLSVNATENVFHSFVHAFAKQNNAKPDSE